MSDFSRRRKLILLRDQVNRPLKLNPFVFTKSFFVWTLLGILGGIVAGIYWIIIDHLMRFVKNFSAGWEVITIMGGAGLILGLIIYFKGDPGKLDVVLNNIRFKGGELDTKHNGSMIVTSVIGISAGSSAGPESPMVQVIGSLGSWLSKKLKYKREDHRSMTVAGMASGFTAMFGVPLAGSLFALEVIHHKHVVQYYAALIPAFVSSGTTFIIFQLITKMGLAPVWQLPFPKAPHQIFDFFWAMLYGAVGAILGWGIIWTFRILKKFFKKANLPFYIQTCLSGIILGILAWKFPVTRFFSHYELIDLLHGNWALGLLVAIMFVKIFSMALTVTSGWRGGFIIPLLFIGAALGMIIFNVFPNQNLGLAVVCCMAAVNSCVTSTPISTVILVGALTGYDFFIPILFASLTGFFLAPKSPLIAAQLGKEK
ncbi:MAG: chloride channel protein [Chitinophagaceae bacterium]|nr:chloride channel protein [Chitinophagaceae bacterium]